MTLAPTAFPDSTTAYRCTVTVGSGDEAATDTKLIYAQKISVAYEDKDKDLEKYGKMKTYTGKTVTVSVYGHDAYRLLSTSTCKLGDGATATNAEKKGKFTVAAAAVGTDLKLTCELKFDTDSISDTETVDVTLTYTSVALTVVASCTNSQYYKDGTTCTDCVTNGYRPDTVSQFTGCKMCPAGEQPRIGHTDCEPCPAGHYSTATEECKDCPVGTCQKDTGQSTCTSCLAGEYQDDVGQSTCKPCSEGSYSSQKGSSICRECPTGMHQSQTGQISCTTCDAGKSPNTEKTACQHCAAGSYSSGGSSICTPCSTGTYQSDTGQTSCASCPTGQYQDETGKASCKDCAAGSIITEGSSKCTPCPDGTEANAARTVCTPCTAGKYRDATTGVTCKDCGLGKYSNDAKSCTECPAGTKKAQDDTSCMPCSEGKYQDETGKGTCKDCENQQYSVVKGSTSCLTCQGTKSGTTCEKCGAGYRYDQSSAPNPCVECGTGETSEAGSSSCSPCPPGTVKNGKVCDNCKAGTMQPLSKQITCVPCDAEKGEYQPADRSTYCKVAPPGFSLKNGDTKQEAEKCPKNTYSTGGAKACTPCDPSKAQYTDLDGSTYCNICQGNIDSKGNCGSITCKVDTIELKGIGTGKFTFKETSVGAIDEVDCDSESTDKITRYCSYNSLTREGEWANADSSKCSSEYTEQVNTKTDAIKAVDVTDKVATEKAVDELKELTTANAESMAPKDLVNIAGAVKKLADDLDNSDAEVTLEAVKGVADIVGGVAGAGEDKLSSVSEGEKTQMGKSVTSVVQNMQEGEQVETEAIALKKVKASEIVEGKDIPLPQPKSEKTSKTTAPTLKMRVTPKNKDDETIAPTVAVFDKKTALALFPKPSATLDTTLTGTAAAAQNVEDSIDSSIVSLEFKGSTSLEFDIDISVDTSADGTNYTSNYKLTRTCKFYNEGTSKWDTKGCTTTPGSTSSDEITYKCACNHNTSFAIILSAAEIADNTQSTVSTILNAINIIFLAITFLCIVPFRQFRTRRLMQIQTQLCIALLVGHVGFILLGTTSSSSGACVPGVIIVQYLFLVAVAWSVCASVTLYEKIVNALKSFGKQDPHYFIKCLSGCWGAPLFMILATYVSSVAMKDDKIPYISSIGELDDEKTEACWVASPWKWVGFIIPVYLCLIVNVVLFIMIARIIIKAGKSGSGSNHSREVKALVSISTTVCLPWLVALLMTGPKAMAQIFQWIFIIVTSIQGPTMFICFVIFQEDVLSNLFGLVGKEPPKALLAPKSSKSTKSAASEVSHIGPTSTAATKKNAQSDIVNIKNPEYNNPVHQSQENIYSKVDEEAPPPQDDNVSSSSRTSGRHLYESTSFTQHGEKDNNIDPVPAVEQGETYENPSANEMAIAQSSYPHVPQLV